MAFENMVFDFRDDNRASHSINQPEEYIDDEFSREGARRIAEVNAMVPVSSNAIVDFGVGWLIGYVLIIGGSLAIIISCLCVHYFGSLGWSVNPRYVPTIYNIGLLFGWFCLLTVIFGIRWAAILSVLATVIVFTGLSH